MPLQRRTTYNARYPKAFIEDIFQEEAAASSDLRVAQARDYNKLLAEIRRIQEYIGLDPNWSPGEMLSLNQGGNPNSKTIIGAPISPEGSPNADAPQASYFPNQVVTESQLAFAIYNRVTGLLGKNDGVTPTPGVDIGSGDLVSFEIFVESNLSFPSSGNAVIQALENENKKEFVIFSKPLDTTNKILITARAQNGTSAQTWNVVNPSTETANLRLVGENWEDLRVGFAMQSSNRTWWTITITNGGQLQATEMADAPNLLA